MSLIKFYRSGARGVSLPDTRHPGAIFIVNRDDQYGDMYVDFDDATRLHISPESSIIYTTLDELNSHPERISELGRVYYITDYDGNNPGVKVGDGKAYIVDLPIFSTVTSEDKEF